MTTARIDWFRVITDLQRSGLSQRQLALEIQVDHKTICNYANGISEPSYSRGCAILDVYRSVIKST